ncbi:hypothetical protein EDC39_10749 [Geothermobacter ehrlichii]|uniref:Uncharacterized protein n=1 Tax=Geothermobacter ehrlichii TaxID=213224 RepID=A0A5D3WIG3_9BACT|nr:hypothetical protein [Geothermobacter ehrlichii]TYO98254.1 hypothetical protein EDC39_10749 [Geothermobacter ehrlichii]
MRIRRLFGRETCWLGFWLLAAALSVLAYNTWSVCCGACSYQDLITPGPAGWILLAANLVAGLVLVILVRVNHVKFLEESCRCGQRLQKRWSFCPRCGKETR